MQKQLFIAIEGIDGSGKTTLSKRLAALCQKEYKVLLTREPGGGTEIGTCIRTMLHESSEKIDRKAQFLLFSADRAQHISHVIKPHLEKGYIVITDRFIDSSVAYQVFGNNLSREMIDMVNDWTTEKIKPDITFYVDISVQEALNRIASRRSLTAYEKKDFLQRVLSGYHALYKNRKDVVVLSGLLEEELLASKAFDEVKKWLSQ